jgi:hypothetical protein
MSLISAEDAFKVIYAHGTGGSKADFYDAAVPTRFNTRNQVEHSGERKTISRVFSLKSVLKYQPCVSRNCLNGGTNLLKTERKVFRVGKVKGGLEGMDGSGMAPFL